MSLDESARAPEALQPAGHRLSSGVRDAADPAPGAPTEATGVGVGVGVGVLHLAIGSTRLSAALQAPDGWHPLTPAAGVSMGNDESGEGDVGVQDVQDLQRGGDLAAVLAALAALEPGLPRCAECRVLVADRWLAVGTLPWSSDLRSARDAALLARAALLESGASVGDEDAVRVDDARHGDRRAVVAYPAMLIAALERLAQACGARLARVRSVGVAAWAHPAARGAGALGVCDEGMTLVAVGERRLAECHVRRVLPGEAPRAALALSWQRLCWRDTALAKQRGLSVFMLAAPGKEAPVPGLTVLPLAAPGQRAAATTATAATPGTVPEALSPMLQLSAAQGDDVCALDAIARPAAAGLRAWWPATAAAVAAVFMLVAAVGSLTDAAAARAALATAERAARPVTATAPGWSREELARVRAVNQAVRELNLPITPLLAALQPPRDVAVTVLAVDVGAAAGDGNGLSTLRIGAEAEDALDMTRYVAHVGSRRPLESAHLLRHERVDGTDPSGTPGGGRYRFTLEATWRD